MLVNIEQIVSHFEIETRGVIHIGAHYGQEVQTYKDMNFQDIVAFEASKKNFDILQEKVSGDNVRLINKALGPKPGTVSLHVESKNTGMSNSILEPKLHLEQYPHIKFNEVEEVEMTTLDGWMHENSSANKHNVICMDVQGFEFEVLLGSKETLKDIECLICEVNRAELYKDGAFVTEIDLFLRTYGLRRIVTNWEGRTWGDACYVRDDVIARKNFAMPKIGLIDVNFSHAAQQLGFDSACLLPTARFDWERSIDRINLIDQIELAVFTDQTIESASMVNGKKKVAWLIEPAEISPNLRARAQALSGQFDAVATHDKLLIANISNGVYVPVASSWISPQDWNITEKSKLVSIIASKKRQTTGHIMRHRAAELLSESDRFGSAFKQLENKIDALRDYMFSVSIENCQQEGYFTEKIIDPMIVGTVPIYWGCPDIGEFFDARGIISFNTLEELQDILSQDLKSFYEERKSYIVSNSKIARRFASCDEMLINVIAGVA